MYNPPIEIYKIGKLAAPQPKKGLCEIICIDLNQISNLIVSKILKLKLLINFFTNLEGIKGFSKFIIIFGVKKLIIFGNRRMIIIEKRTDFNFKKVNAIIIPPRAFLEFVQIKQYIINKFIIKLKYF